VVVEVAGRSAAGAAPTTPSGRRRTGADLLVLGILLVVLAVVLPLVIAAHYGAFGIPRSDDWSYLLVQFRFVHDGTVDLNNWVSMTLVGQVALGAPVAALSGRSIAAMQVFTAFVGLVGLAAVVDLGRRLGVGLRVAGLIAVAVAVGPLWGPLAASFMTDVPTFTFTVLTLTVGVAALQRRPVSTGLLGACLALGFVAFSVRQYALVVPIAVAVVAAMVLAGDGDRRRLRIVGIQTGVLLVCSAVLFLWWRRLPGSLALSPIVPTPHTLRTLVDKGTNLVRLLGLLVVPAVVLAGPVRIVRRARLAAPRLTWVLGGASALVLAGIYLHVPQRPFVGNYVTRDGTLSTDVLPGVRPNVMPSAVFDLLVLLGSLSVVLLVVALVPWLVEARDRVRRRDLAPADPATAAVALTVGLYLAAYAVAVAVNLPLYDRYVLPLVPLVAFLLLRPRPEPAPGPAAGAEPRPVAARRPARAAWAWAIVSVVVLGLAGLAYTTDSASFDGTRWAVAKAATRLGYEPLQINGGFEWDSWHLGYAPSTSRPPNSGTKPRPPTAKEKRLHYCVKLRLERVPAGWRVVVSRRSSALTRADVRVLAAQYRPCVHSG
jgi:hypothetical protein